MTDIPAISLDDNWHYRYFPALQTGEIANDYGGVLRSITDWAVLEFPQATAWVWRTFTLEATDFCVRYYLHVTLLPQVALIVINDHKIKPPTTPPPYILDVTDYVTLEENVIGFRVTGAGGTFGHIHLQAVACDEL
jgi:hypothetical protein